MGDRPFSFKSDQPSRTVQSFRRETNLGQQIRAMVKANGPDPRIPRGNKPGLYTGPESVSPFMDSSMYGDFHAQQNRLASAMTFFNSLPLQVRQVFNHQPYLFFSALQDPRQRELLEGLGVLKAPLKKEPPLGSPENPIITKPLDSEAQVDIRDVAGVEGAAAPPVPGKVSKRQAK